MILSKLSYRFAFSFSVMETTMLTQANGDGDYVWLYKMTATTGFADNSAGVNQYRAICENNNLNMVGCGTRGRYYCNPHDNCIPMPENWGCDMLPSLYSNTHWDDIVALHGDGDNDN